MCHRPRTTCPRGAVLSPGSCVCSAVAPATRLSPACLRGGSTTTPASLRPRVSHSLPHCTPLRATWWSTSPSGWGAHSCPVHHRQESSGSPWPSPSLTSSAQAVSPSQLGPSWSQASLALGSPSLAHRTEDLGFSSGSCLLCGNQPRRKLCALWGIKSLYEVLAQDLWGATRGHRGLCPHHQADTGPDATAALGMWLPVFKRSLLHLGLPTSALTLLSTRGRGAGRGSSLGLCTSRILALPFVFKGAVPSRPGRSEGQAHGWLCPGPWNCRSGLGWAAG